MAVTLPVTFATKEGTAQMQDLDTNFEYLAALSQSGIVFDAGTPSSFQELSPNIDCGGVS